VQFFAKKGGLIFRYEKNEYIFVIWALKGMSPVNLKKKFENFCDCITGLTVKGSAFKSSAAAVERGGILYWSA
jgi:hypothetical protein